MKNIPLIIPNFNQITYLINLINWWKWYVDDPKVFVLDNGSTEKNVTSWLGDLEMMFPGTTLLEYKENDCVGNLRHFLSSTNQIQDYEYYVISDPDIMPLPSTPPNFLEIFKHAIDNYGFHHVGFGLMTDDIPEWFEGRANMLHDEKSLLNNPTAIEFNGKRYSGYKAPIDTTFALYRKSNGGWSNPQSPEAWSNSLRLFQAYHLPWYLHPEHLNDEMKNYFSTARYRIPGVTSTGVNNYRPNQYKENT